MSSRSGPTALRSAPAGDDGRHLGQRGQGFIEYGLILVLVAVVCVVSLVFFGDQLAWLLSLIASAV